MEKITEDIKQRINEKATPMGILMLAVGVAGVIDAGLGHWLIFFILAVYGAYLTFRNPEKETEKEVERWLKAETWLK